jgi:hypothetical protein
MPPPNTLHEPACGPKLQSRPIKPTLRKQLTGITRVPQSFVFIVVLFLITEELLFNDAVSDAEVMQRRIRLEDNHE